MQAAMNGEPLNKKITAIANVLTFLGLLGGLIFLTGKLTALLRAFF